MLVTSGHFLSIQAENNSIQVIFHLLVPTLVYDNLFYGLNGKCPAQRPDIHVHPIYSLRHTFISDFT